MRSRPNDAQSFNNNLFRVQILMNCFYVFQYQHVTATSLYCIAYPRARIYTQTQTQACTHTQNMPHAYRSSANHNKNTHTHTDRETHNSKWASTTSTVITVNELIQIKIKVGKKTKNETENIFIVIIIIFYGFDRILNLAVRSLCRWSLWSYTLFVCAIVCVTYDWLTEWMNSDCRAFLFQASFVRIATMSVFIFISSSWHFLHFISSRHIDIFL